jgi:hypothetical protein
MFKNSFFKTIPFLLFVVLFNSCDKEFNVIGEDLIGENSFNIIKEEFPVVAYNQKLGVIQSNNLEVNPLGIYDNPSFGTTRANFVTQLVLTSLAPTFAKDAVIKSVVLTVPYFSHKDPGAAVTTDGSSTYVLDSIYGKAKAKMKLSIYESTYYMRDLDPVEQLTKPQKYYNDQYSDFYQKIKPLDAAPYYLNDDPDKTQNEEFFFDPAEHVTVTTTDGKDVTSRNPPGMQLNLNKNFFQNKILNAPAGSLATNDAFKDYFRGIFFNIESIGTDRNMAMLNFRAGKISITYTETIDSKEVNKIMTLDFKGNTVSFLDESNTNVDYTNATIDDEVPDANLYLKGGQGSLSVLELFGEDKFGEDGVSGTSNGVADRLDIMRKNKYLINEADLVFHLNTEKMGESPIPQRIYLYDYTNNQVLSDYYESSVVSSNTKYNKYLFGGIFKKKDVNGVGDYYKFRITNHIRNLVKYSDSTNVKLGLVVTEDINKYAFYAAKDKNGTPSLFVPMGSVMNPLGAILFGSNLPIDDKRRLKLEIYYTKPN